MTETRMSERQYCVYILTNKNHTVLYTGVTNDLLRLTHVRQGLFDIARAGGRIGGGEGDPVDGIGEIAGDVGGVAEGNRDGDQAQA